MEISYGYEIRDVLNDVNDGVWTWVNRNGAKTLDLMIKKRKHDRGIE
jgi:hypothetical protein